MAEFDRGGVGPLRQIWKFVMMMVDAVGVALAFAVALTSPKHTVGDWLFSAFAFAWGAAGVGVLIYFLFFRPQRR